MDTVATHNYTTTRHLVKDREIRLSLSVGDEAYRKVKKQQQAETETEEDYYISFVKPQW